MPVVSQILTDLNLEPQEACFIGDDLPDLPVLKGVGLGVAVSDAAEEVRQAAHYTTSVPGGRGALRETIELILKNQRRWDDLIAKYAAS